MPRTRSDRVACGLLALLCVALLLLLRARADNPLGVRTDSWSEANVIVSARNVAANGWAKYGGAAQHQVDRPPFRDDPFYLYAHYPLGGAYANWVLWDLGVRSVSALRWPLAAFALATVVLWYALVRRFFGPWTALASAAVLATARAFLEYADNLFQGHSLALVAGMMLAFAAATAVAGTRRRLLLATCWVLLFLNGLLSWEWYLWSQIFLWGYALLLGVPFRKRWLLVFALAPVLSFGVQSSVRRNAMGPEPGNGVWEDLLRRTVRLEDTADTPRDVTLTNYPLHVLRRFQEMYGVGLIPLLGLGALWALVFGGASRGMRGLVPGGRLLLVLLACSLSWWCTMLQHTAVHMHVMRHALFFFALLIGLALSAGLRVMLEAGWPVWGRAVAAAAVALVLLPHAERSYRNIRLHLDPAYVDPQPLDSGWGESAEFAGVAAALPSDVLLLTNHYRLPLLRYWTQLPVYPGTLVTHPFNRTAVKPGARARLELSANHLRDLYGDALPRVLYLYFFLRPPEAAYAGDPILRILVDGSSAAPTPERRTNFSQLLGGGPGASWSPIVARGKNWVAFEAGPMLAALAPELARLPVPTRATYGPPR